MHCRPQGQGHCTQQPVTRQDWAQLSEDQQGGYCHITAVTRLWPGSDQAVTTAADADGFLDLSQDLLRSAAATCWLSSLYELINTQLRQLIRPLSQIQLDTDTDWEFLHLVAIFDDQLANKSEMIFLQSFWRYKVLVENFEKLQKIFYFYLIT